MIRQILMASLCSVCLSGFPLAAVGADELQVLFLGDEGPHRPAERFAQLQPVLAARGIELVYTDRPSDLSTETLGQYDAVVLYANIPRIEPQQERALLDYVAGGGGFVPIHSASYCFLNSDAMVRLIGAQFHRHGSGVFRTEIVAPDHPVMSGFAGFESWDETYVHHRHNPEQRTVLSFRVDGDQREPWTWVRRHGQGRVFYTAWGHDQRTWQQPGFHNLIERGIRWAAGDDPAAAGPFPAAGTLAAAPFPPAMTPPRNDIAPFEYRDVGSQIPHYLPGQRWGTQGEPIAKMQQPLPPHESIKHFVTPEGFQVELYASEPELGGKPIAMNWDHRGRLWVCESYDYPNELQPPGQGRDRIRICADTDGDGRADQFSLFADQLSIPTAIVPCRGGAIVQNGHQTLFLKDTDGDQRADVRTVLIDNWEIGDTHGGVSNLRLGLDNWIWGMQGYNKSQPRIGGQQQQSFAMGFFRFRLDHQDPPQVAEFEFVRSTDNNTWGLGISETGLIFGSTANRNPSVFMPIPNRYYERVRGWTKSLKLETIADTHLFQPITDNVRQVDHHGGYTAGAGHALYTARRYPQPYWNRTAFVAGPTGHLVGTFVLTPEGSGFRATSPFNLLASDDEWTAPIAAEVGPDGNVWVLDWYNYIVQHNPTPDGFQTGKGRAYESELRDKRHGRIYRVVYGAEPDAAPFTESSSPSELVARLADPNMQQRLHAQWMLVERRDPSVIPELLESIADPQVDAIGLNVAAIHGLWTLQGLGVTDGAHAEVDQAIRRALRHPSAGVRRAAIQVLPPRETSTTAVLDAGLLDDSDAQVRLAALLALADLPPVPAAGEAIVTAMTQPRNGDDPWIPDAAVSAAANHCEPCLLALCQLSSPSAALAETAGIVAEHYARGAATAALPELSRRLGQADPEIAVRMVSGLQAGWPPDRPLESPQQANELVARMLPALPLPARGSCLKLARLWGSDSVEQYLADIRQGLIQVVADPERTGEERIAAAKELISLAPLSAEPVAVIMAQLTPQESPQLAIGMLQALADSESDEVASQVLAGMAGLTPGLRSAAIDVLLARGPSAQRLLQAISQGQIELSDLSLGQRQNLSQHPNPLIRMAARTLLRDQGAMPNADRQQVIAALQDQVLAPGDASAGKLAYKKFCANCHAHSGEGGKVGPDLTGMAVHPKTELLVHILDPNRSVEGNYRTYSVLTVDGRVLTGMLATESKTTIELIDAEGRTTTLLREDIERLDRSANSLMPEGFEQQATPEQLRDLLEFLTQRGRYLPLSIAPAATISTARGMFYSAASEVERLIFPDWSTQTFREIPFALIDPEDGRTPNAIMLHSPLGEVSRTMPRSVSLPCGAGAKRIHLLSGVSGWGFAGSGEPTVSLIVRLHYGDGSHSDHPLLNGQHFADYIRRVDVPDSEFAFDLDGRQLRYLSIEPTGREPIERMEFIKGDDHTAPIVMAITLE